MRNFSISIDIAAPRERVWQVMSDVEGWHEWTASIRRVKRLGAPGRSLSGVGRWSVNRSFHRHSGKVTAIELGKSFTWTSVGLGFRAVGYHAVEARPGGSRATLSLEFQGVFGGVFGRVTKGITERYLGFEAKGLKARSENPA